jgi:hypothetical protein
VRLKAPGVRVGSVEHHEKQQQFHGGYCFRFT